MSLAGASVPAPLPAKPSAPPPTRKDVFGAVEINPSIHSAEICELGTFLQVSVEYMTTRFSDIELASKLDQQMGAIPSASSASSASSSSPSLSAPSPLESFELELSMEASELITADFHPKSHGESTAFQVKLYGPRCFSRIRQCLDIASASLQESVCHSGPLRFMKTPGKSSSLFFFSHDHRFLLKSVSREEVLFLRKSASKITEHFLLQPQTLLSGILACFRITSAAGYQSQNPRYLILMTNVFTNIDGICHETDLDERYDLKGSTVGRSVKYDKQSNRDAKDKKKNIDSSETVPILKDLDVVEQGKLIYIGPKKGSCMLQQLREDCIFLEKLGVMDYSVIIAVHRKRPTESPMRDMIDQDGHLYRAQQRRSQLLADEWSHVTVDSANDSSAPSSSSSSISSSLSSSTWPPMHDGTESVYSAISSPSLSVVSDMNSSIRPAPLWVNGAIINDFKFPYRFSSQATTGSSPLHQSLFPTPLDMRPFSSSPSSSLFRLSISDAGGSRQQSIAYSPSYAMTTGISSPLEGGTPVPQLIPQPIEAPDQVVHLRGGVVSPDKQIRYYVGLIDYLQPWNMRKRGEHILKASVQKGNQISAVNPHFYSQRLQSFVSSLIR